MSVAIPRADLRRIVDQIRTRLGRVPYDLAVRVAVDDELDAARELINRLNGCPVPLQPQWNVALANWTAAHVAAADAVVYFDKASVNACVQSLADIDDVLEQWLVRDTRDVHVTLKPTNPHEAKWTAAANEVHDRNGFAQRVGNIGYPLSRRKRP